jgi:Glycosyltransferase sugar-binding region containing DXD motif
VIPNRFHFVWFGREFPLTHALAIRSVAATCAPEAIVLHATDDLSGQPDFDPLVGDLPAFSVRRIDIAALLDEPNLPDPGRLRQIWDQLIGARRWAALSDVLRYLVLYREGGIYLDLDTLTVRDLRPLLSEPGFCGRERILVDAAVHRRGSPLRYLRTVPLDVARWVCSRTERGIGRFARIAALYPAAINGAVLALPPLHPVAREALRRVPDLVPELERRRPVIGPDLLQDLIDGERRSDVTVFGPAHFYPLGPQMAAQIFRLRKSPRDLDRALAEAIGPETYVVHWYNDGLKALPRPPDRDSIQALAERQMFSRLARPFLRAETVPEAAAAR